VYRKTRATNLEVQETRHVLQLLRPFLTALDRWNGCVPKHIAMLASRHTSCLQKAKALAALKAVLAELGEAEIAFVEATVTAATHSRVEDIRLSMQQVRARIAPVVALFEVDGPEAPALAPRALPPATAEVGQLA